MPVPNGTADLSAFIFPVFFPLLFREGQSLLRSAGKHLSAQSASQCPSGSVPGHGPAPAGNGPALFNVPGILRFGKLRAGNLVGSLPADAGEP